MTPPLLPRHSQSGRFLLPALLCFAAAPAAFAAGAAQPAFSAPESVEVAAPFPLHLASNGADIKAWIVDWGDGTKTRESSADAAHAYEKAGIYRVSVTAAHQDGTEQPAIRDYASAILEDKPAATIRLDGQVRHEDSPGAVPAKGIDRFTVEFWLNPGTLEGRQDIVAPHGGAKGAKVYLAGRTLCFELPGGARFLQSLPLAFKAGDRHYIAITYDRVPLFPFQNTVRFYFDGLLGATQSLDVYDTGPVILPSAATSDASDLAFYDRVLPPHRILEHAGLSTNPGTETVTAVPATVKPFTVDAPRITRTVAVPLDATPGVDNGPALRAAIAAAAPGSRLRIVDKATGDPGTSFYINSLDQGHDWSAIRVQGKHDLEIDGGGATFVFGTNCRQFFITKCQRVAFRDFAIDLDQRKYRVAVYARILSLDTATGDARFQFVNGRDLSPDRTVPADISMWRWRGHDPRTLRLGHGPFFETGKAFEKFPVRDAKDPSILIGRIKPSYIATLEEYRKGPNFFLINNARFQNTPVGLWGCEQITFDRVNFYASLGMVFLSGEVNHLRVTGCRIGLPPGLTAADRPLASAADGYHFHDTQGCVLFENNEIALTDDDAISIKDAVWRDIKAAGPDAVTIKGAHPGDEFEFYRWDFSPLDFRATVLEASDGKARLDRNLPANLPGSFLAMKTGNHTYDWIIRDSYLHDYYGRLLLCAPHGLITGNEFNDTYLHLGANNAIFDSSGIASQITLVNNLFVNADVDSCIWGAASSYPVFQGMAWSRNSFEGGSIRISNAGAPLVWENYFEKPAAPRKPSETWSAVTLSRCSQPSMVDNVELGNGARAFSLASKDTGDLFEQNNLVLQTALVGTSPDGGKQ